MYSIYLCQMKKAGILGGGQLGRMLLQTAINYPVETFVMENDNECPAAHLCHHFVKGDITNFEDVYNFGKDLDIITIEIESVNEDALEKLETEGVKVYPRTSALRTIKNKITQKEFYQKNNIPTCDFIVTKNRRELKEKRDFLPAVHKLGQGGYDGRGVEVLRVPDDCRKGFDAPAILEKMVDIKKELSIIVAVDNNHNPVNYPAVDMVFDPELNLLDYQLSPADLPDYILKKAEKVANDLVKKLESPGLFAVELFVDNDNNIFVNETAPRVHNSGHHTIEANYCSQFDMLWRIMLDYPLGNTSAILPAAIINILGANGYNGKARYTGIEQVLQINNVFVHMYGKKITNPGRKMGHVTILGTERNDLIQIAHRIKETLQVVS